MPPFQLAKRKKQDTSKTEGDDTTTRDETSREIQSVNSFFKDESSHHRGPLSPDNSTLTNNGGGHGHGRQGNQSWGRGIRDDFRETVGTWWFAEMKNFSSKTIAVSLFLFIAVIAPSITFGAVYAKRTNNYMGAVELLMGTAWCGIFYSLVSNQNVGKKLCPSPGNSVI